MSLERISTAEKAVTDWQAVFDPEGMFTYEEFLFIADRSIREGNSVSRIIEEVAGWYVGEFRLQVKEFYRRLIEE